MKKILGLADLEIHIGAWLNNEKLLEFADLEIHVFSISWLFNNKQDTDLEYKIHQASQFPKLHLWLFWKSLSINLSFNSNYCLTFNFRATDNVDFKDSWASILQNLNIECMNHKQSNLDWSWEIFQSQKK